MVCTNISVYQPGDLLQRQSVPLDCVSDETEARRGWPEACWNHWSACFWSGTDSRPAPNSKDISYELKGHDGTSCGWVICSSAEMAISRNKQCRPWFHNESHSDVAEYNHLEYSLPTSAFLTKYQEEHPAMQRNTLSFVRICQQFDSTVADHVSAWILKDHTSQTLDLDSPASYRECVIQTLRTSPTPNL